MSTVDSNSLESGQEDAQDEDKFDVPKNLAHVAARSGTQLIPQPSDNPQDPLNWSWSKKHIILLVLSATAFLPDYGAATGASTQIPQAECVLPSSWPSSKLQ